MRSVGYTATCKEYFSSQLSSSTFELFSSSVETEPVKPENQDQDWDSDSEQIYRTRGLKDVLYPRKSSGIIYGILELN